MNKYWDPRIRPTYLWLELEVASTLRLSQTPSETSSSLPPSPIWQQNIASAAVFTLRQLSWQLPREATFNLQHGLHGLKKLVQCCVVSKTFVIIPPSSLTF